MPSLQLDLPTTLPATDKQTLARRLGAAYSRIMRVSPDLVTVVVRDHGAGTVWRRTSEDPVASALIMCDVRRGSDRATRGQKLAQDLIDICQAATGIGHGATKVEFTRNGDDEMFHSHLRLFQP